MDREKVIKGLEVCFDSSKECNGCPYIATPYCKTTLRNDVTVLLKEQEPIMIKTVMINGSGRNGRCQNCLMMLNEMDYPNFCGNCGQAVKWDPSAFLRCPCR